MRCKGIIQVARNPDGEDPDLENKEDWVCRTCAEVLRLERESIEKEAGEAGRPEEREVQPASGEGGSGEEQGVEKDKEPGNTREAEPADMTDEGEDGKGTAGGEAAQSSGDRDAIDAAGWTVLPSVNLPGME
jgi:hypothetical protein